MKKRPDPHRFALRRNRWRRGNDVQVRTVTNDLIGRNRRWKPVFEPEKAHALAYFQFVEHGLIRHPTPSDGKIKWHESGLAIVAVDFAMEQARIEGEMRERLEMERTAFDLSRIDQRRLL